MKCLLLLIYVFGLCILLSEVLAERITYDTDEIHNDVFSDDYKADSAYKCPAPFGSFADPDDCSKYYTCVAGVAIHRSCKRMYNFDIIWRKCLPFLVAVCGKDGKDKETTTSGPVQTTTTTTRDDIFVCPSFVGNFPHPKDCSKYYSCVFFRPTLKSCEKKYLFDAVKMECRRAKSVHCGDREIPGLSTTAVTETDTEIPPTTSTEISTAETYETTFETTDTSTETPETTTEMPSTDSRPTGPPETTCDEDDLDCIITDTGDVNDWFKCPEDVGYYPHPSSDKLFIFCMNGIASVKKCGLDLVFSKELLTCVEIK